MRTSLVAGLLVAITAGTLPLSSVYARNEGNEEAARQAQENAQRAQQGAQRQAQENAQRAQQGAQRQAQENAQRAQEGAQRQAQENAQRAQQNNQRQMQEEQQRQQREAQDNNQRNQEKMQQEQQRNAQKMEEQQQRGGQQNMERMNRDAMNNNSRDQQKQAQEQQKQMQKQQREAGFENRGNQEFMKQNGENVGNNEGGRGNKFDMNRNGQAFNFNRGGNEFKQRTNLPALQTGPRVNFKKATPPPYLAPNVNGSQRQQYMREQQTFQNNTYAVPISSAPQNYASWQQQQMNNYFNNYQASINNLQLMINARNTFFNAVQPGYYPSWWQPTPGWAYCNGFTLGGALQCGMNSLDMGWRPYWGPQPEGYICNDHYFPTPWIYNPYLNAWMQPGMSDWSQMGPGYNYTGPITVEVLEPTNVMAPSPYGNPVPEMMNQMYLYNAFYYPDSERWGYLNREGYFVWLNI